MTLFNETWLTPPAQGCHCGGGSYGNEILVDMRTGMEAELVPLNLSSKARYPFTVVLPMQVVSQVSGLPRQLRIDSPTQLVPIPVKDWLLGDSRYRRLFDENELADEGKKIAENAGVAKTAGQKKKTDPANPDGQPGDPPDDEQGGAEK